MRHQFQRPGGLSTSSAFPVATPQPNLHDPLAEERRPTLARPAVRSTLFQGWGPKL